MILPLRAPVWARGGHLQTILGHVLRVVPRPPGGEDVCISLPDGDELAARVHSGESDTVILLFHGLSGSTAASYMSRVARNSIRVGHSVVLVNHRGCGEGIELSHRKPYHSGSSADISAAVAFARSRFGSGKKYIAVGFSLSGNALLLLLGKGEGSLPDAAIAVNPPVDLHPASKTLREGFNRLYDWRFVRQCQKEIKRRKRRGWIDASVDYSAAKTIYDFDSLYTAPHAGFASREDYYEKCSSGPWLEKIGVPTIILTAKDDPFVDYRALVGAKASPLVRKFVTETGGHMGYVVRGATPFTAKLWMDSQISAWIEELRRT